MMSRQRLPDRRPSVTRKVIWVTEASEHKFYVSMDFHPATGTCLGVAYADGQRTGTALQHSIVDACILISQLLQRGATPDEVGRSLGTVPVWGEDRPASVVGAIVAALREEVAA